MSLAELGRALGISKQAVHKLTKRGMPTGSVEAAKSWRLAHQTQGINHRVNNSVKVAPAEFTVDLAAVAVDGETFETALERLRRNEKAIGLQLDANLAKIRQLSGDDSPEAKAESDKLQASLAQLRREQTNVIKALADAESKLIKIQKEREKLIDLDEAKALINGAMLPLLLEIKKLPDAARNDTERALLVSLTEGLLNKARESAAEYVARSEEAE
jgi:hypothetical protein